MSFKLQPQFSWFLALLFGLPQLVLAATENPCTHDASFLDLVDRPTVATSACTVPVKKTTLELGYQYQKVTDNNGHQHNFPQAELRLGLPANSELVFLLPNYTHPSTAPSGFAASSVGVKHELAYSKRWVSAIEGLFTLPSGSAAFGTAGLGFTLSGIATYTLTSKLGLSLMLSGSTQTTATGEGGQRYESINPNLVLSYNPKDNISLYAEVYGQSKTAPHQGSGFNADTGIIYLCSPHFTLDLAFGQRLSGDLGGFEHYIGTGMAMLF